MRTAVRLALLITCVHGNRDAVSAANVSDQDAASKSPTSRRSFLTYGLAAAAAISYFGLQSNRLSQARAAPVVSFPMIYMRGCAYAELDVGEFSVLRLLIDSSAIKTVITVAASLRAGVPPYTPHATLRSRSQPSFVLQASVVSPVQGLPEGVDGLLGMDLMLRYAAAELDWASKMLRLHLSKWDRGAQDVVSMPMRMVETLTSKLPFVRVTFADDLGWSYTTWGLVDTGLQVTEVTPALASLARLVPSLNAEDVLVTAVLDAQPARMRASRYASLLLGSGSGR